MFHGGLVWSFARRRNTAAKLRLASALQGAWTKAVPWSGLLG